MVIKINAKCSDLFSMLVEDKQGNTVLDYDGYVPNFMPEQHFGDHVELTIDVKTGKILNWPKDCTKKVQEFVKQQNAKGDK